MSNSHHFKADDGGTVVYPTFQVGDFLHVDKGMFAPETSVQRERKHKNSTLTARLNREWHCFDSILLGYPEVAEQMLKEMGLWQLDGERGSLVLSCKNSKRARVTTGHHGKRSPLSNKGGEGREKVLEQARNEQQQEDSDESSVGSGGVGSTAGKRKRCCARKLFSELKAFKAVLNKVEQIKTTRLSCIFLPKHTQTELNTIEWYWGYVKHLLASTANTPLHTC